MKGYSVETDWRTIQMFLDDAGVYEVEADADDYAVMRCSCSAFRSRKACKHSRYVKRVIEENDGKYEIKIPEDVDEEFIIKSMETAESFRELVIHHARVEVID